MKHIVSTTLLAITGLIGLAAFKTAAPEPKSEPLKWYTWEEATELSKKHPKKMVIDVYTDWCGWCKRMDKTTFVDPAVTKYIADNFYPVKLNAEQKADIVFNGETFKFVDSGNGKGVHTLAYALLDGKMGYPSLVYLNEKYERIMISPGYKEVPDMMLELKFAAEEKYKDTSWEDFKGSNGN